MQTLRRSITVQRMGLLLVLGAGACATPNAIAASLESASLEVTPLEVTPYPASVERTDAGVFYLNSDTAITWSVDREGYGEREARRLARYIEHGTGWAVDLSRAEPGDVASVHLTIDATMEAQLGAESYRVEVDRNGVQLCGASGAGLFYATQTLRQLMSPFFASSEHSDHFRGTGIASVVIEDAPRFGWRGMHLDVGRHLFGVDDIKRLLDAMAFYKLNVFHWHLTEDQGWRIEIKRHPLLTTVGGFRSSSPVLGDRSREDGVPYGGFYTQDEVREVVAYAADLHIDVMPEIELPGHSTAAIAAYPELGNPEFVQGVEVGTHWGVYRNTLNPSEATLRFYEQVFDEVLTLFPFEFVHIGGDEAPKTQWENSPTAQARMQELGVEDEHELQAWFVAHFERYLSERGRRLVGWDEIQEGGLPSGATMMVWRGWHYGVEAARKGHDIVMAPTSHTYFDYYQGGPAGEPEAIGGMLPLEQVYSFDPVPPELSPAEAEHVLGAQAQLWSEYLPDWSQVEYMAFPRLLALSEAVWSPAEKRDWASFRLRLDRQFAHLDARGIGYRMPAPDPDIDVVLFEQQVQLEPPSTTDDGRASHAHRGPRQVMTLDGRTPDKDSPVFATPVRLNATTTVRVALVRGRDHVGPAAMIECVRVGDMESRAVPASVASGLLREVFRDVQTRRVPDFNELQGRVERGEGAGSMTSTVAGVNLDGLVGEDRFAVRLRGWLQVDSPGVYTMALGSDDGSRLTLEGATVIDNDGEHGHLRKTARVQLPAGSWRLEVGYFESGGAESLALEIDGPGAWRFVH